MTAKRRPHVYYCWGIEIDDYERVFLVGIGFSPWMINKAADWSDPITILRFKTRREARSAIRFYRDNHGWGLAGKRVSQGGSRGYRSIRVVRLTVTAEMTGLA